MHKMAFSMLRTTTLPRIVYFVGHLQNMDPMSNVLLKLRAMKVCFQICFEHLTCPRAEFGKRDLETKP